MFLDVVLTERLFANLVSFLYQLFDPRSFDDVPLELMPRLLELVQQELGYNGFGTDVTYTRRRNSYNKDPTLRRLYEVFTSWNIPLLVAVREVVLQAP